LDDGVILVEGQEDVVYYRKIVQQLGIDMSGSFAGWGVGVIMNAWDVYGRQEITEEDIHREMDRLGK
jgi:hypothetical protein